MVRLVGGSVVSLTQETRTGADSRPREKEAALSQGKQLEAGNTQSAKRIAPGAKLIAFRGPTEPPGPTAPQWFPTAVAWGPQTTERSFC